MGDLGITWTGFVAQLVCFLVLLVILSKFAYKPLQRMLDERSARIKAGLEKSEEAERYAIEMDEAIKSEREAARKEGQELIAQAKETAELRREEYIAQAKQEAEALLERARSEIQLEKDQALEELRAQFADLTILAAGKVINEELDKEKHRRLIEEVLRADTFKGKE
ncbi:MAG: F0F1 ATP synthase subunit B [Dehalococcoidia bacterium]